MNQPLDRRIHAFRPDLADIRLKGLVEADRFVEGRRRRVVAASTPIRRAPRPDAAVDSEALFGEAVLVFEETVEGWAWVQLETDGYVGFVSSDALGPSDPAPTHRVAALRTFVYPAPDMKLPPLGALSLGARLAFAGEAETRGLAYRLLPEGAGAVVARHVEPLGEPSEPDFVTVAERFLETPYLWGGRSSFGIDCSGLVQLALEAIGIEAPRDSDQQAGQIGEPLPDPVTGERRRGDLLFWKGHVGMLRDAATLLHASGFHMAVVSEPLDAALARIGASAGPPSVVRRLEFS